MREIVLRHPDLPHQPLIAEVGDDGTVTPNLADAGWVIDLDTDPAAAKWERPEPRPEPAPAVPHFAGEPTDPTPPAQPETTTTEQGSTSLDITKE
jgi:hypothetical protein